MKTLLLLLLMPLTCMANLTVYTATGCGACEAAKQYMKANHIAYQECNVLVNKECRKQFDLKGYTGTPTFEIDGKTVLIGFDPNELQKVLKK